MNLDNIDEEFISIIDEILVEKEFGKLKGLSHHGLDRFDHSMKVAYHSYKISKFLKLDYKSAARAGLLHDFFIIPNEADKKERFKSVFKHPNISVANSKKYFTLSKKEENIIKCHMFPLTLYIPKYKESWVVLMVDKMVSALDAAYVLGTKTSYASNLLMLLLINLRK